MSPIAAGTKLVITKGNKKIGLPLGATVEVTSVRPQGAEFSHYVWVDVRSLYGKTSGSMFGLQIRYEGSLSKPVLTFGCGDGINSVKAERA